MTGEDTTTSGQTVNSEELEVEIKIERETKERSNITNNRGERQHRTTKNQKERRERKDKLRKTTLTGDDTTNRGQTVYSEKGETKSKGCRYRNDGEENNRGVGIQDDNIRE